MDVREAAGVNQIQAALKHGFSFGGKARDEVSAKGEVGAQLAKLLAQVNGLRAAVATLHPLKR